MARPVPVHRFQSFAELDRVVHAVSTRTGGVSQGPFASLNVGFHVGDEPEAVLENRRRLCQAAELELDRLVAGQQVLGSAVGWVTEADCGRGARDRESALPDVDALMTDSRGVVLAAFSADCPLVAIAEPRRGAVGLAHASRKGTFGDIAGRTVRAMRKLLGCDPGAMRAAIAPSIGPCCYEVGEDVLGEAAASASEAPRFLLRDPGRLRFDLWGANVAQLVAAGVPRQEIEVAGICTRCHAERFFSHRASGGRTGRFAVLLGLR
ncbi:MAG: polyphenol oxidase family protein [Candidatus Brocadiia bacterium]